MRDKVELLVDGKKVDRFKSYEVTSNLFTAADAFTLELSNPGVDIPAGARCRLVVNGAPELDGIVDVVERSYDKAGSALTVSGRDLMGLLVDSYCEEFVTLQNIELKALAERLLKKVPHINRKAIVYGKGDKSRAVELTETKEEYEFTQIQPGETVFEVLRKYALSRGMLFFSRPDGTMVFGLPRAGGEARFTVTHRLRPAPGHGFLRRGGD
jgi:prophage tail gpP-like protein